MKLLESVKIVNDLAMAWHFFRIQNQIYLITLKYCSTDKFDEFERLFYAKDVSWDKLVFVDGITYKNYQF